MMKGRSLLGLGVSLAIFSIAWLPVSAQSQRTITTAQIASTEVEVAPLFRSVLPQIKKQTRVPILLPSELPSGLAEGRGIYLSISSRSNGYKIKLESSPDCGGANVCFIGYFGAERGGRISSYSDQQVRLTRGITGYYEPLSCGGSCSPPSISWSYQGVIYSIQMRLPGDESNYESIMIQLANSAIEVGLQDAQVASGRSPNTAPRSIVWRQLSTVAQQKRSRRLYRITPREFPNGFAEGQVAFTEITSEHISYVVLRAGKRLNNLSTVGQQIVRQNTNFNSASSEDSDLPAIDRFPIELYQAQHLIEVSWWAANSPTFERLRIQAQQAQQNILSDGRRAYFVTLSPGKNAWCIFDNESAEIAGSTCVSIVNSPVTAFGTLNLIAKAQDSQI